MKILNFILISPLITGCTIDGGAVVESDKNKIVTCTDTRDGEVFGFNTNSVNNARQGFGTPSSIDIVTLDGKAKTISDNMRAWLKCDIKEINIK